jgi:hypothetical protein
LFVVDDDNNDVDVQLKSIMLQEFSFILINEQQL